MAVLFVSVVDVIRCQMNVKTRLVPATHYYPPKSDAITRMLSDYSINHQKLAELKQTFVLLAYVSDVRFYFLLAAILAATHIRCRRACKTLHYTSHHITVCHV